MKKIITKTEKETFEFAKNYSKELKGGDIVGLIGNLGAGKTVFSKGIAAGLGIKEELTSPTFVYMKIYEVQNHSSIKKLCHIDAYRIKDDHALVNIGALEYFNNKEVLTMIEWADRVNNPLLKDATNITFEIISEKRYIYLNKKTIK
ncbi:MAG: tRNA (adenosine(37)-N6)-threonylcarbamoyltransferase complex ATPase subunit type 1 TsaE [Patescibacteria group bacterium]|jgi:tRNA threonylcarbamoyladenosine biosynthesis protein TsaE|nr:tRNA (adenosine(37)-N6)-threonylcarbamoyltransferase complex ATPase subunit type 1 TsaE [Patescibacteria group bacterium]